MIANITNIGLRVAKTLNTYRGILSHEREGQAHH